VTTPDDWCEVMDMYRASCAHCRPPAERRHLDRLAVELELRGGNTAPRHEVITRANWAIITASYHGRCMFDCGEPIERGERIARVSTGWVHEDCARDM